MLRSFLFALEGPGRRFSQNTFHQLFIAGWIVDGRDGGLVLGRRHSGGHIHMIREFGDGYIFFSNLEGGEYIINHAASERNMGRIKELNSDREGDDIEPSSLPVSKTTRILNLYAEPFDKLLFIDVRGQFIVNRIATRKHFAELERINDDISDFRYCNPDEMVEKQNA